MIYFIFAVLFTIASYLIKNNKEINPDNVFMSLFGLMFGAMHSGTAAAMGPDMGKAAVAIERIFSFIRYPSSINAVEIDKEDKL
jgi:hypothetical protein